MNKTIRKIELMYRLFGHCNGHSCGECSNLIEKRRDRVYRKCIVYGVTNSEASDWAKRWNACGMFNLNYSGNPIISVVRKKNDFGIPMDGQMEMRLI